MGFDSRRRGQLAFVILIAAALGALSCGSEVSPSARKAFGSRLLLSSGGGALAQVTALTKRFTELHPGLNWDIENVGSDAGISLVTSRHSDLGAISRGLTSAEEGTVSLEPLGIVGTGVAVNPENPVKGLTLAGITPTYPRTAVTVGNNAEMISSMHSFVGGIGMVTLKLGTVDDPKARLLAIDGVPATIAALNDGSYKIRRPLYLVYPIDPTTMKPGGTLFVEFVRSSEGQKILAGF